MSYKTILLHLHDTRRATRLLEAAIPLARDLKAHLIAIGVIPPYVIVPGMDGMGTSVSVDEHRTAYQKELARLERQFLEVTAGQPVQSEWRVADAGFGSVAGTLVDHGRSADLIIAAQKDDDWASTTLLEDPARLTMEIGRPVLVVPNSGRNAQPLKRITVAWNGRREAARALFDAMPLLERADVVNVVWIDADRDTRSGDLPTAEICAAIARHGVKVEASQATAIGADVGPELLRQASIFGSDLLVMGCYGHSRLREFILGGASRHVLSRMTLPVLMSH